MQTKLNRITESLIQLDHIQAYAYEMGYHELGVNPVADVKEAVECLVAQDRVAKLEKALEGVVAPFAAMVKLLPDAQQQDAEMRIAVAKAALNTSPPQSISCPCP